jgi:hypothetical protein
VEKTDDTNVAETFGIDWKSTPQDVETLSRRDHFGAGFAEYEAVRFIGWRAKKLF